MKWQNPADRLDDDRTYDLLVSRGLDDWLQPADFFDLARFSAPSSETEYRRLAVDLASRLIHRGHARPGDVAEGRHRPWSGSPDEQLGRVAELWLDTGVDARFAFVWFDLTESGRSFAGAAFRRTTAEPD
jgi:hypothetical protein